MINSEAGKPQFQKGSPRVTVSVELLFDGDIVNEIETVIEACKGDRRDRFGHLRFWKCMISLIPFIMYRWEITRSDVKTLASEIGFSEDQIVRSLDRFVEKGILVKDSSKFNSIWRVKQATLPFLYFLCKKKRVEHIVRRSLTFNEEETI
jgi:hypothetical protein